MKATDLFVRALEAEGVDYVFGLPGEENLDLVESLRRSRIRLIVTRHEQAAGFMAATYGRLTGRAGVALATLGPGATNLVTAVAHAQLGGMPMVVITGQKALRERKQGEFQRLDVVDMLRPLTSSTQTISAPETLPALVREAFRLAQEERPSVCHLELPQDVAREESDEPLLAPSYVRRPVPDPKAVARAAQALAASKRPLLMIGAGANRKRTARALAAFAEKLKIPFFTTQMGKGVLSDDDPLCLGTSALSHGDFLDRAIEASDCILNVGHDVIEKPPFSMQKRRERTVIHCNFFGAQVDRVYFPQLELVGDIAQGVAALTEILTPQAHWDFSLFAQIRQARRTEQAEQTPPQERALSCREVVRAVREQLGDDDVVCLDNGLYKLWFARDYPCRKPNTLLLDNALATMGAGLSAAIATRLVQPDRKVIAVCGDGGFLMNGQELETAVRLGLDLTVLVLRDDAYGMIGWKQKQDELPRSAVDLGNPDFVAHAESYGAHGRRVRSASQLGQSLREVLTLAGVHVIEVALDYASDSARGDQEIPRLSQALKLGA